MKTLEGQTCAQVSSLLVDAVFGNERLTWAPRNGQSQDPWAASGFPLLLSPLLCPLPWKVLYCHSGIEQAYQIKNFWDHSPKWFPVQYSPEGALQQLDIHFIDPLFLLKEERKPFNQGRTYSQLPEEQRRWEMIF